MRIDSHQHFWRYNAARHAWITDEMVAIRRDFLPRELEPELAANGIDASVAVQADQSEEETLFLLDLAKANHRIAAFVGWVDLRSSNVAERLKYFSQFPKLRGFRHIAQSEPDDRLLVRNDFVRGVAQLRQFGFTYDILIYARQLPAAMELASRLPQQPFVIDHIAKPAIRAKQLEPWATHMREIAQNKNVYCKVSGLVTEAHWKAWTPGDLRPYLDVVFEAFGANRLMFGSDWPVCLVAASYARVLQVVSDYLNDFSETDQRRFFGENAARFYRLDVARHAPNEGHATHGLAAQR